VRIVISKEEWKALLQVFKAIVVMGMIVILNNYISISWWELRIISLSIMEIWGNHG